MRAIHLYCFTMDLSRENKRLTSERTRFWFMTRTTPGVSLTYPIIARRVPYWRAGAALWPRWRKFRKIGRCKDYEDRIGPDHNIAATQASLRL